MDPIGFKNLHYRRNTLLNRTKNVTLQVRMQGITICIPQNLIYKYVERQIYKISLLLKIRKLLTYKNIANLIDKLMNSNRIPQNFLTTKPKILQANKSNRIFLNWCRNRTQNSKQKQAHLLKAQSMTAQSINLLRSTGPKLLLASIESTSALWILKWAKT